MTSKNNQFSSRIGCIFYYFKQSTRSIKVIFVLILIYLIFLLKTEKLTLSSAIGPVLTPTISMVHVRKFTKPRKYISSNLAASSRLGNHLFELSALLAIARKLERIPTFYIIDPYYDQMLKDTDFVIPGLLDNFLIINQTVPVSITPTDFQMKCCMWDDPDRLKNITDEYIHIRGTHYQSWKFFPRLRNELMGYLKSTTNNFSSLPKSSETSFITCVHIRRTDFVGSGFHVPDEKFILSAMQFVEQKEKRRKHVNMTTVFFGDDFVFMEGLSNQSFTLSNGRDLKLESFISHDDPADSIIYSRHHCDVVLFTAPHSTFGWWLGYLSKGNQVYYTDIKYVDDNSIASGLFDPDDYYPPHWTPFKYNEFDNTTVVETMK